jgi:hypothetical protein
MTKTFDEICSNILKEMITNTADLSTSPQAQQMGAQTNQQTPNQNQSTSQQYQKTPTPQQSPSANKENEELVKLLQQKMQDEKFKQQLLQMLQPTSQTNAANKPA